MPVIPLLSKNIQDDESIGLPSTSTTDMKAARVAEMIQGTEESQV